MKIHRIIIALGMLVSCCASALHAEDTKMNLHLRDGSQLTFTFADRPKVTFNRANALIITGKNITTTVKGFSTVKKITFDVPTGGIDEVTSQGEIAVKANPNTLTLSGFKAGTQLTVSALNGIVHRSLAIEGPDPLEVSLDGLASGLYIIAVGDTVCKVAIK